MKTFVFLFLAIQSSICLAARSVNFVYSPQKYFAGYTKYFECVFLNAQPTPQVITVIAHTADTNNTPGTAVSSSSDTQQTFTLNQGQTMELLYNSSPLPSYFTVNVVDNTGGSKGAISGDCHWIMYILNPTGYSIFPQSIAINGGRPF